MSLAAALARDGVRPTSSLPTIKCSNCAEEIEISEMSEHVCGAPGPAQLSNTSHAPHMSNPFILRRFNESEPQLPPMPHTQMQPMSPRLHRPSLPKINPEAANVSYLAPRNNGAQDSPVSPAPFGGSNSSKPPFARSTNSPAPRLYDPRPPSPELSANLDCAFPPFPAPASSARRPSTPSNGRKTPNGSDRAPSRAGSRLERVLTAPPEPFDVGPKSPRLNGGESVLKRMQTLHEGPFHSFRRGSADTKTSPSLSTSPNIKEQTSEPFSNDATHLPPSDDHQYQSMASASTAYDDIRPLRTKTPPPHPVRPIDEHLHTGFPAQIDSEPMSPIFSASNQAGTLYSHENSEMKRSNTFPSEQPSEDARTEDSPYRAWPRNQSEPGLHTIEEDLPAPSSPPSMPKFSLPPRKDSVNSNRMDYRIHDAPPVPKAIQEYRQNSTHSPSDSGSSATSMTNSTSNSNANSTSPVGSTASSFDTSSPMLYDTSDFSGDGRAWTAGSTRKPSMQPGMRAEQSIERSPPKKFMRPGPTHEMPVRSEPAFLTPLESPMDPLLQHMQEQQPLSHTSRPARPPVITNPVPMSDMPATFAHSLTLSPVNSDNTTHLPTPAEHARSPDMSSVKSPLSALQDTSGESLPARRPTTRRATNAKAVCRGCRQVIEGKSVKAADGRLTGRWHKACFVCRTCREPFTTADFYVINNEPYCEHHYHEANGSLCHGCNRGIEGQYLETSSSTRYGIVEKKYHPRCFTCTTCRVVLTHDYFEITSRVFCERHALAAMRAQARMGPGGLQPPDRRGMTAERRTTRLINPMLA